MTTVHERVAAARQILREAGISDEKQETGDGVPTEPSEEGLVGADSDGEESAERRERNAKRRRQRQRRRKHGRNR